MNIEKIIRADATIIECKKRAKQLKSSRDISLMSAQNIAAQQMGFDDWHNLYTTIKEKHTQNYNPIEALVIDSLINEHLDITIQFRDSGNTVRLRNKIEESIVIDIPVNEELALQFIQKYIPDAVMDNHNCTIKSFIYSKNQKEIGNIKCLSIPCYPSGFDLLLQLEKFNKSILSLSDIGLYPHQIEFLKSKKSGLILFTGTARSGKNTLINSLADNSLLKVIEIKDNYAHHDLSLSESNYIKDIQNALREGADIIKSSELYSEGKYKAIINIHDGTLILAHASASSCLSGLIRLEAFEVGEISSTNLSAIVYQNKLPKLCPHCKKKSSFEQLDKYNEYIKKADLKEYDIYSRGSGCKHCYNGIKGFTVCAEMLDLNDRNKTFIKNKGISEFIKYWPTLNDGDYFSNNIEGKGAKDIAIRKLLEGIISLEDLCNTFF